MMNAQVTGRSVVFASGYTIQGGGYDVLAAFCGSEAQCLAEARAPGPVWMVEDLLRESMAALSRGLPQLIAELRAGVVIGRHGSSRRMTPATRFYLCDGASQEVKRDGWLFLATRIIEDAWVRLRADASGRSSRFSFEVLGRSVAVDLFARELAEFIEARLRAAPDASAELTSVIDDLVILGHPLVSYDARCENGLAWDAFGYGPTASHRFGLLFDVSIDTAHRDAGDPEIKVVVTPTEAWSPPPPGFTV